jgi:hypothetical protein
MRIIVTGDQMTLLRLLIAFLLVCVFYAPVIISAVQVWQLYTVPVKDAQHLPPPAAGPQVALQFVSGRDDAERDPITERFAEMTRAMHETSRLPAQAPPPGRAPHLQDRSKVFTVGVAAGRKPPR